VDFMEIKVLHQQQGSAWRAPHHTAQEALVLAHLGLGFWVVGSHKRSHIVYQHSSSSTHLLCMLACGRVVNATDAVHQHCTQPLRWHRLSEMTLPDLVAAGQPECEWPAKKCDCYNVTVTFTCAVAALVAALTRSVAMPEHRSWPQPPNE
jgi:hypothetical protein